MRRKHYFVWMLTVALTAASVMPMTVYAQPAFASGGEVKVVEGDVNGEMQGGVMSPGAMAIEGSDLKVNGNVSGGLVSDGSNLTVGDTEVGGKESTGVIAKSGSKATAGEEASAIYVDTFPGVSHVECVIMMQYCGKEKKK